MRAHSMLCDRIRQTLSERNPYPKRNLYPGQYLAQRLVKAVSLPDVVVRAGHEAIVRVHDYLRFSW